MHQVLWAPSWYSQDNAGCSDTEALVLAALLLRPATADDAAEWAIKVAGDSGDYVAGAPWNAPASWNGAPGPTGAKGARGAKKAKGSGGTAQPKTGAGAPAPRHVWPLACRRTIPRRAGKRSRCCRRAERASTSV